MACGSAPNTDPNKHAFWHPVWHLGIGNMEGTDTGNQEVVDWTAEIEMICSFKGGKFF